MELNTINRKLFFIYFFIIFLVYSPVFLVDYAFSDDFSELSRGINNIVTYGAWEIQLGRPLYALMKLPSEFHIKTINDLSFYRLFAVFGIGISACFIYLFLDKFELFEQKFRVVLPLFLSFIPALQLYASWWICFPFSFGLLLACGAAYYSCLDSVNMSRTLVSIALLCLSFALYQPVAMSYLFFMALYFCGRPNGIKLDKLITVGIVITTGMLFSLFLAKIPPLLLYDTVNPRAEISFDFIGKFIFFVNEAFVSALNNYSIFPTVQWAMLSLVLLVWGIYCYSESKHDTLIKIVAMLSFAIASYAPCLLTKDNWSPYRSLVALELFTCTFFMYGFYCLFQKFGDVTRKTILGVMLFIVILVTDYNITNGMIIPAINNYTRLNNLLATSIPKTYDGIVWFDYSKQNEMYCYNTKCRYDEWYFNSQSHIWSVRGMIDVIINKEGYHFKYKITPNDGVMSDDGLIVDLRDSI